MDKQCMNNHCSNIIATMTDVGLMVVAGMLMMRMTSPLSMTMLMVSVMLGAMSCGTIVCMSHKGCGHLDSKTGKVCSEGMGLNSCQFAFAQQLFLVMGFLLGVFMH